MAAIATEIEAKFLHIDIDAMRAKLRSAGAICEQPMRLMRRKTYDYPDSRLNAINAWVRIRDEGAKVTLSFKQQVSRDLHGTKEAVLTIDNFDEADSFLAGLGLEQKSFHETKRESWVLDGAHIDLDEWPWVKPYMEIEGPREERVASVASRLGLAMSQASYGSAEAYIVEYDVTEDEVNTWREIAFVPVPSWLEKKRRAA